MGRNIWLPVYQAHMERVKQTSPKEKSSKAELRQLQEEVMGLKLKEAKAVSEVKDAKQKLMELETQVRWGYT